MFYLKINWTSGGSQKVIESVRPFVRPSVQVFSCNCIIVFSEFWHNARNPYEVVRDRAGFFEKTFFAPKFGKMDQKLVFDFIERFGL